MPEPLECLDDLFLKPQPTRDRPLLGVIILVVEDSRFASEAVRLVGHRSGARIRRAESLASAERHLRTYRPRVALVDVGLPDGSGLSLIKALTSAEPRLDAVIAMSGDDTRRAEAMAAGADAFLPKPIESVAAFQSAVLAVLPGTGLPHVVETRAEDTVTPDPIALRDDLALALDLVRQAPDAGTLQYVADFLAGLARVTGREGVQDASQLAFDMGRSGQGPGLARLRDALKAEIARLPAV